ncbi:MAG: fatty acid desaturase [Rariglobus sp.]
MSAPLKTPLDLPRIEDLGRDLLQVTTGQRILSVLRPLVCFSAYFVFASNGWWLPAVLCVAGLMFITYVSTSHDLVHRTLGLPRWLNEVLLALVEGLVLRSGHAFRLTHLQHHRRFPEHDDIEGAAAHMAWWRALLEGVALQSRLFLWAWRRARPDERRWMLAEAVWIAGAIILSVWLWPVSPVFLVYIGLVVTSSWLYPLATVWLPHRAHGETVLEQTHAVRGRWVPEIFLQHTYHLEHHLYPSVSSHKWPELARRLDVHLAARGVQPVHVP